MPGSKSLNSKLFYSTDSGTNYVEVANVTQVARPKASKADIDMTTLGSTAKEKEKDVPDYGTVSYAFNFVGSNASHQALIGFEASGATVQWKVELPEPGVSTVTTQVYQAIVDSVGVDASVGGKQEGTLDLTVSGAITDAYGVTAES